MIIQLTGSRQKKVIDKFNELYIQTRRKYLLQYPERYITRDNNKDSSVIILNDGTIQKHLDGDFTLGVFSGGRVSKFMTFDVDVEMNQSVARWATLKIVHVLTSDFNISVDDIHVSFSGSKGYHVDLFFDKQVPVAELEFFYRRVVAGVGELPDGGKIEFRPSWTQGVKLPLGKHQKTGHRCWFLNPYTLEPIQSADYLLEVEPMNTESIEFLMKDDEILEFESVVKKTNVSANVVNLSDALQKIRTVIEIGQLTASGTRHQVTFDLARFYNSQGFEQEEAVAAIMEILHATPRGYFSADSKPEYWLQEAERLVALTYEKDYKLGNTDQTIRIYRSEILAVLQAGTFRQKQILFAMIVTSKRYGDVFYLTFSKAMQMVGTGARATVSTAIKKLVEDGYIEYVRKKEVDKARSRDAGFTRYKPNRYRLLLDEPADDEPFVEITAESTLVEVSYQLLDAKEITKYVKRKEFRNRWSNRRSL